MDECPARSPTKGVGDMIFFSLGERALGAVRRVTIRLQVLGRPPELSKGGKNQV